VGGTRVARERLRVPHWPASLSGLRVAALADLHTGGPQVDEERLDELVGLVACEDPDVVALLGDYIDPAVTLGEWIEPEAIAARLARASSRLGTVAVMGNHDWGHTGPRMRDALRDAGITVLENDAVRIDAAARMAQSQSGDRVNSSFWIAGLGDLTRRDANIERALESVPLDDPVVLLSHNPDVFPRVPDRVSLTICGHTHGAQVDIPVVRDVTTPSRFGARYTRGHIVEGGRHMYASAGVGTSRFPVRFRAKPEIALLELRG
jgi:predicted MPP superfamily phosphohydrolase